MFVLVMYFPNCLVNCIVYCHLWENKCFVFDRIFYWHNSQKVVLLGKISLHTKWHIRHTNAMFEHKLHYSNGISTLAFWHKHQAIDLVCHKRHFNSFL